MLNAAAHVLLFIVLLLIPVGAYLTARPMLHKATDGKRRFYAVNAILAMLLCLLFITVSVGLGADIYRCDILGIPNCD